MNIKIIEKRYCESFETFQDRVNNEISELIKIKQVTIFDIDVKNLEENHPCAIIKYTK